MSSVQKFVSGARKDPEVAFSFEIYTQSTILPRGQVGFSEVSGLRSVTNVIEHKKGNETFIRKIFGRTTVENITARHGLDNGDFLSQWYRQVKEDEVQLANGVPVPDPRQTVVIEQMARGAGQAEGHVIKRWLFFTVRGPVPWRYRISVAMRMR